METLVQTQSDVRAMTLELAKSSQTDQQLRAEIDKLRLQLASLSDVRREKDMAMQYSRVIRAKEE